MHLEIQPGAPIPISEQIRRQFEDAIAAAELLPGDRLARPTVLAEQLVAAPGAVRKAYRGLEADGFCRRTAAGLEVAPASLEERRERARRLGSRSKGLLDDLELARTVQRKLVPPSVVEGSRFRVAARVLSAGYVSGDFYDVIDRGSGVVDIVVGDVAGKGIGASLVMAYVKARLPMLHGLSVADTLRELGGQLHRDFGRRQFVAMAYARVRSSSGRMELGGAALPPPWLVRRGTAPRALGGESASLPLGVRPDPEVEVGRWLLEPGDRLLFCSDGLPEAPGADGEPLGYEAFGSLLERWAAREWRTSGSDGGSTRLLAAVDDLLDRVAAVTNGRLADDQTAVLFERRGD